MPDMNMEDVKEFYGYQSDAVGHRVGCSWFEGGPCHCGLLYWLGVISTSADLATLYPRYYQDAMVNSEVLVSVQDIRRA